MCNRTYLLDIDSAPHKTCVICHVSANKIPLNIGIIDSKRIVWSEDISLFDPESMRLLIQIFNDTDYLYFFKSYLLAKAALSSSGIDLIYPFHPGHQLMCHFHKRPKIDLELLSYFALKLHFSQLFEDIRDSPCSCNDGY